MARAEERLQSGTDLLSAPGENCPHMSNDHPTICTEKPQTPCRKCPEYLDGLCDLIPWDVEKITEAQKRLLDLYRKRDAWYNELDPIYAKIHSFDDPIQDALKEVREEQGR